MSRAVAKGGPLSWCHLFRCCHKRAFNAANGGRGVAKGGRAKSHKAQKGNPEKRHREGKLSDSIDISAAGLHLAAAFEQGVGGAGKTLV